MLIEAYETQAIRLACQSATAGEIDELYLLAEALEERIAAAIPTIGGAGSCTPSSTSGLPKSLVLRPGAGTGAQPIAGSLSKALDRDRHRDARPAAVAFRAGRRHSRSRPSCRRRSHAGPHAPGIRKRSSWLISWPSLIRRSEPCDRSSQNPVAHVACLANNGGLARRISSRLPLAAAAGRFVDSAAWGVHRGWNLNSGRRIPAKRPSSLCTNRSATTSAAQVCFDWDYRVDIRYGRKPLWFPDPNGRQPAHACFQRLAHYLATHRQPVLHRRTARADSGSDADRDGARLGRKTSAASPRR